MGRHPRGEANGPVIPDELKHGAGVKRTEDPPTIDDMLWCKVEELEENVNWIHFRI